MTQKVYFRRNHGGRLKDRCRPYDERSSIYRCVGCGGPVMGVDPYGEVMRKLEEEYGDPFVSVAFCEACHRRKIEARH